MRGSPRAVNPRWPVLPLPGQSGNTAPAPTVSPMTTPVDVFVDFSRIGYATRFTSRVRSAVRAQLHEGDVVTVSGDDVGPLPARVVRLVPGGPAVAFELLIDWVFPALAGLVDVSVDFSRVGCAVHFTVPVDDSVREL